MTGSSRLRAALAGVLGLGIVLAATTHASAGSGAPAPQAPPETQAPATSAPTATPLEPRVDADGNTVLASAEDAPAGGERRYVVRVADAGVIADVLAEVGGDVEPTATFDAAIDGFAAALTSAEVAALRANDDVVAVEVDQIVRLHDTQPTPPSWGLDRIDQRARPLNNAYTYHATGAGVDVYVIDSGINETHTDFTGRLPRGAYIDFGTGTGLSDCNGHGTHVAGTVGGTAHGVAKKALIVPVKVFDCDGSTAISNIITGIEWVINDHVAGRPAVANLSLGSLPSVALDDAVRRLIADGVTVVVAAGNDAQPACNFSPARVPEAITVAASNQLDDDAPFSNYGPCNDLFAPGVGIVSASAFSNTGSELKNGTSMAAPHVAGAAAMILQMTPTLTPAAVAARIDAESTKGALTECCGDPDKLLFVAAPVKPGTVRNLAVTRGDRMVRLTWTAPATNGGAAITDYVVQRWSAADPVWRLVVDGVRPNTGAAVTELPAGGQHRFRVGARNSAGIGVYVMTAPMPAAAQASVPRAVTATGALRSVVLRWQVPASTGGMPISDYVIQRSQDWGATWVTVADGVSTATTFTVPNLTTRSQQLFRIAARTGGVTGTWAAPVSAVPT